MQYINTQSYLEFWFLNKVWTTCYIFLILHSLKLTHSNRSPQPDTESKTTMFIKFIQNNSTNHQQESTPNTNVRTTSMHNTT